MTFLSIKGSKPKQSVFSLESAGMYDEEQTLCRISRSQILIRSTLVFGAALTVLCLALAFANPSLATADTESDLAAAQSEYDDMESQLTAIASEYQDMAIAQAQTLDQIEATKKNIASTEQSIRDNEKRLKQLQEQLSQLAVDSYMNDDNESYVRVLLSSESFSDFISNLAYVDMIYENKSDLIHSAAQVKNQLAQEKLSLEEDAKALEELKTQQDEQIAALSAKKDETQALLEELGSRVDELTKQQNAELFARAAEQAAMGDTSALNQMLELAGDGSAASVIACCYSTPSPGANWCAAWVTNVFSNAGIGCFYGDACDMYAAYCYSSDKSELQPGMIVAVSSNDCGWAGALYGHVGIYIGNGMVMENIGSIVTTPIDDWISYYGTVVTPRWGWLGGVTLY